VLERVTAVERELAPQMGEGVVAGTAEWHRGMSSLLRGRGLALPARGHMLRAMVLEAASPAGKRAHDGVEDADPP
jgi:hypothetical protein